MSDYNYSKVEGVNLGLSGKEGFLGRWQITKTEFVDFNRDLWCEGTDYRIVHFESDSNAFIGRCMDEIVRTCDADFIRNMKNIMHRQLYVPMIDINGEMICLHSQMSELSFDFLNSGVISNPEFKSEPFDPTKAYRDKYEYLSIWLSLSDVVYCADQIGEKFDARFAPTVVLMPIHYLSFDYKGNHYMMMSWGDKNLSNFTMSPLPEDEHLTLGTPVYSKPLITLLSMALVIALVCGLCAYYVIKLWNSLDIFVLYRLVVLAIPVLLIYLVTWYLIIGLSMIFGKQLFKVEKKVAMRKQREYVESNIQSKISDIHSMFPTVVIPDYSNFEVKYNDSEIETAINKLQMSMAKLNELKNKR